jgi:hypothetical protein
MAPRRVTAVCALVALSAGVAANVTLLQRGPAAIWALRGALQPAAPAANTEARVESSANPSDGPLTFSRGSPGLGVGDHDGRPMAGIGNATPSPQSGTTLADVGRIAEGASPSTAIDGVDVIRAVQRELSQRGYKPGVPSGVATAATRRAIMAFQHDHGLPPTGEPSEALLKAIVFENSDTPRAPGKSAGPEQRNHRAPITTAAIKRHSPTLANHRTVQAASRLCAGAGHWASQSTCERGSPAHAKERHGAVVPSARAPIGAARLSTGWTAPPRVYGWEMLTSPAPRPTKSSRARIRMSEQKNLSSAVASRGLGSRIWKQFPTFRPMATTVLPPTAPRTGHHVQGRQPGPSELRARSGIPPVPNSPKKVPVFPDVIR